jgi:signal transduction histidine kinase/ActR/RegA family two-component response regulator
MSFSAILNRLKTAYPKKKLRAGVVLFTAYLAASIIGIKLFTAPAVILPAAGIAIAGLFIAGLQLFPVVFLGTLIAYVFLSEAALPLAILLSTAHTIQATVGAFLLKKFRVHPAFGRLRDMLLFMGLMVGTSLIVPTMGISGIQLLYPSAAIPVSWGQWWIGMTFSTLIVTTFIIRWSLKPHRHTAVYLIEAMGGVGSVILITFLIFWSETSNIGSVSLIYILLVPLFWIALRIGPRIMTSAFLLIAILAIGGIHFNSSAERVGNIGELLFNTELSIIMLAVFFFILVSIEEERKDSIQELEGHVQRLKHGLEKTRSSEREKADFIAILAHELRNPLSPVISSLELLSARGLTDPNTPHLIEDIDTHIRTITVLLDDLLDITRISRNRLQLEKKPLELQSALYRALQTSRSFAENRNHRIFTEIPSDPIRVEGDFIRLTQIFTNILFNAAKYTEQSGTITLTCVREGNEAVVRIHDTGIGIPPDMMPRIFHPFTRVNQALSRVGSGLGIGLSLTKQLVQMHGGRIYAESEGGGQGSTFTVKLPILLSDSPSFSPTADKEKKKDPTPAFSSTSDRARVLIVDDNKAAVDKLRQLLEHYHYIVHYAYSGEEALAVTAEFKPHVVLLDIGLPDRDGYEVARLIRDTAFPVPRLIALTGYGQEEDKRQAEEAGFDYHLTKPIGIKDLLDILEKLLARERTEVR